MKIWLSKKQICLKYYGVNGYCVKTYSLTKPDYIKKILDFVCDVANESFFTGIPREVYNYAIKHKHRKIGRASCRERV